MPDVERAMTKSPGFGSLLGSTKSSCPSWKFGDMESPLTRRAKVFSGNVSGTIAHSSYCSCPLSVSIPACTYERIGMRLKRIVLTWGLPSSAFSVSSVPGGRPSLSSISLAIRAPKDFVPLIMSLICCGALPSISANRDREPFSSARRLRFAMRIRFRVSFSFVLIRSTSLLQ